MSWGYALEGGEGIDMQLSLGLGGSLLVQVIVEYVLLHWTDVFCDISCLGPQCCSLGVENWSTMVAGMNVEWPAGDRNGTF